MSVADYDSGQEAVYLLCSPENAKRLMAAVARDRAGQGSIRTNTSELSELVGGEK